MNTRKKQELLKLVKQYKRSNGRRLNEVNLKSLDWNYNEDGILTSMQPGAIIYTEAEAEAEDGYSTKIYCAYIIPNGTSKIKYQVYLNYYEDNYEDDIYSVIYKKFDTFQDAIIYFKKITGIKVILKLI